MIFFISKLSFCFFGIILYKLISYRTAFICIINDYIVAFWWFMKCYPFFGRLVSSFNVMLLHSNSSVSISLDANTMKVSIVWCALSGNQFLLEGGLKISSSACLHVFYLHHLIRCVLKVLFLYRDCQCQDLNVFHYTSLVLVHSLNFCFKVYILLLRNYTFLNLLHLLLYQV